MRRIILVKILSVVIPAFVYGQLLSQEDVWDVLLNDVKIKYAYAINYNAYFPRPKFGEKLKKLDGQVITVKGFFLPVDVTGSVYVISYNPMNMCFFCSGSGIETIIEINARSEQINKFKRLKTDSYIKVKGALKLNEKDYEHLVYILNDTELMEIIK